MINGFSIINKMLFKNAFHVANSVFTTVQTPQKFTKPFPRYSDSLSSF